MNILGFNISRLQNVSGAPAPFQSAFTKIQKQSLDRIKQSVSDWRDAIEFAEDVYYPNNEELIRLYRELILDPQVSALIETMLYQVQSNAFKIVSNGEENEDKTKIFKSKWFSQLIKYTCEARYYGFSYVQLDGVQDDKITGLSLIPREYVIPQWQLLKVRPTDKDGYDINKAPLKKWTLFIGEKDDLGLLSKAAPYVIFKREVIQFWAAYNEVFGQPLRVGKTSMQDNARKSNMASMLESMSYSPWAVLDTDDSVEFISASGMSGEKTYEQNIRLIDEQLSKLFTGQTMVLDNGSSRSQGEVHERNLDAFVNAQMREIAYLVNDKVIPMLVNIGLPLSLEDRFEWVNEENLSMMEKAEMIAKISPYYKLDKEFVETTLGVKISEEVEEEEEKPTSIMEDVANYYQRVTNGKDNH